MTFTVRDLETYEEMLGIHRLQREIWGLSEPDFGMYPPMLTTIAKNGGVVLGAFDDQTGQMVAFSVGFLGREPGGPLKLCSQAMGVLKAWRGRGIAEALKQAQREQAMAQGLPLITWTYDPLEGPNAHLNLHKLRAISRTYWRDLYGSEFGALNAGLPTDRLVVEWWLEGAWLKREQKNREVEAEARPIFDIEGTGLDRRIASTRLDLDAPLLYLETLADLHPVKEANLDLALDWRLKVRQAFETYFARGYIAVDFHSRFEDGQRRNGYLLRLATPALLAEIGIINSH